MKRIFILALLPLLVINFLSCTKVKDEINKVTTTKISTDIVIPIDALQITTPKSEDFSFSMYGKCIINENSEIKKYLDKIQSINIKDITIKIRSAEPEDMILKNCTLAIANPADTTVSCSYNMPANFPLAVGSELKINENDIDWELLNKIIESLRSMEATGDGVINASTDPTQGERPAFSFDFIVRVEMTVNADL